jgi:hypothetical protein
VKGKPKVTKQQFVRKTNEQLREASEELGRITRPGEGARFLRLERAVEKTVRGEEKVSFEDALAEALGTTLGSPAMSVAEIKDYVKDMAAMILKTALAHRNYRIKHGPWTKDGDAYQLVDIPLPGEKTG